MVAGSRGAEGLAVLDVPSARSSETAGCARGADMNRPEVLGVVVPHPAFLPAVIDQPRDSQRLTD
jgi:hypothetical protein